MNHKETVTLKRDCEATEIPSGRKKELFKGTELIMLQAMGGTFTVMTHMGEMSSIAGKDADALGKEVPVEAKVDHLADKPVEEMVWKQLRTCYDPEIPHNIVDLGLVYDCKVSVLEGDQKKVDIKMTLTAPGCGMGEWLKQDVKNKIMSIPSIKECQVDLVFDPPWDRSKMHPALRREIG